jgi:hypothetical protein
MGCGVAVETRRSGVGVETAEGSFFLCDRVPFEVRPGPTALGVETAGAGVGAAGRGIGPMAWKSVRWLEKVFWDCRILRTPGVVPLPVVAVRGYLLV